jgi:hypothetical protein
LTLGVGEFAGSSSSSPIRIFLNGREDEEEEEKEDDEE